MRAAFALIICACGARSEIRGGQAEPIVDAGTDARFLGCSTVLEPLCTTAMQPDAIAIDEAFVYFHDAKGVWRVSKDGGQPLELASATASVWPDLSPMAIAGGFVFYAAGDELFRVSKTGGPPTSLGASASMLGVAANPVDVWFWSRDLAPDHPISRMTLAGQPKPDVADVDAPPGAIFFTDTTGYAASDPGVYAIGIDGGTQLLSGLTSTDVVADEDAMYFTSNDATNGGRIERLSLSTFAVSLIPGTEGAYTLAIGNGDLYFTDRKNSRVRRIIGKVGQVAEISGVGNGYSPIDIAVDDQCVYFTIAGANDGLVMAAPRH